MEEIEKFDKKIKNILKYQLGVFLLTIIFWVLFYKNSSGVENLSLIQRIIGTNPIAYFDPSLFSGGLYFSPLAIIPILISIGWVFLGIKGIYVFVKNFKNYYINKKLIKILLVTSVIFLILPIFFSIERNVSQLKQSKQIQEQQSETQQKAQAECNNLLVKFQSPQQVINIITDEQGLLFLVIEDNIEIIPKSYIPYHYNSKTLLELETKLRSMLIGQKITVNLSCTDFNLIIDYPRRIYYADVFFNGKILLDKNNGIN
jgi:hypothetical protein